MDRLGSRIKTEYNIDGNPVLEISCDRDGGHREVRSWEYDGLGYPEKATGGGFSYRYEYRPDGKLVRKESAGKTVLACTYHPDGSLKTMTDITGKTLSYDYDKAGRLSSVRDGSGRRIVGYRHTDGGKLKEILHRSGVRTTYEYDGDGNTAHLKTETGEGSVLCDLHYEYDLNGNRTAKTGGMVLPEDTGGTGYRERNIRYGYDRMDRLILERGEEGETAYRYDLCGNRLEKESERGRERCTYNRKNQPVSMKLEVGEKTGGKNRRNAGGKTGEKSGEKSGEKIRLYEWDSQGNLRKETGTDGERYYEYNTRNQQTRVVSADGRVQENLYDGENLRAGLLENGKRSTFLFDKGEIIAELDGAYAAVNRYIRGYGVAAMDSGDKYHGFHLDEQMSTGWITDGNGKVESAYEYDAFGMLKGSSGEGRNRILYTGQQYDAETAQYYLRARFYNPVTGRFTQEDPYRGDGLNLYAYCGNNPVVYYDGTIKTAYPYNSGFPIGKE